MKAASEIGTLVVRSQVAPGCRLRSQLEEEGEVLGAFGHDEDGHDEADQGQNHHQHLGHPYLQNAALVLFLLRGLEGYRFLHDLVAGLLGLVDWLLRVLWLDLCVLYDHHLLGLSLFAVGHCHCSYYCLIAVCR